MAGEAAARAGEFRTALRRRDFRLLLGAFVVNESGGWAFAVVLAVYLFERTGSPTVLAVLGASRWIPAVLATGYASVLADRYERTRLLQLTSLVAAGVMALLVAALVVDAPVPVIIALAACEAVVLSPYRPAAQALTPEVVEERELAAANSVYSSAENLVVVLGPLIAGGLLLVADPVVGVVVNMVSFLVAAAMLSRLGARSRGSAAGDADSAFRQWLVGVRTMSEHRTAVVLVFFCALDSAVYGASTVIFLPLSESLGTGSAGYSYLLAGMALGGVLGAVAANRLSKASRLAPVILGSLLVQTAPFLLLLLADHPLVALALMVVSGSGMVVVDVLAVTALQRDLPGDVLGRVFGVFDAVVILAITVASLATAFVFRVGGLNAALVAAGGAVPALALVALPVLVRIDRAAAVVADRLRPRVELLSALDVFSGLDRTRLERLAAAAEERHVPAGGVIVAEGLPADALYVLVGGSVAVTASTATSPLPPVEAPGYVGEIGLLHNRPRTATVTASEPSRLLRIQGEDFLDAIKGGSTSASLMSLAGTRLARTSPSLAVPTSAASVR